MTVKKHITLKDCNGQGDVIVVSDGMFNAWDVIEALGLPQTPEVFREVNEELQRLAREEGIQPVLKASQ
jgi:hypothetical protein